MELKKGTTLQSANYTIECTLGSGGFGITYKAFQSSLQRKVAIKEFFMKDLCSRDGNTMTIPNSSSAATVNSCKNKFIKEARIVAALNNAHIVRIYDVFEENGTAYYVMELLERGSLKDLVESTGPLGEKDALDFIEQVSEALYHIHDKGLLHLDIKPANIMLNQYRQAVLIDFGICRHYDQGSTDTTTTTLGVSDGYSPLEQYAATDISSLTPATDIYSLGATLMFLLTGEKPPKAVLINEQGLHFPSGISSKTKEALIKAMSPMKAGRFQDVISFAKSLGLKIHIPQTSPADMTAVKPLRIKMTTGENKASSKPFMSLTIGILAGVLVVVGVLFFYNRIPKNNGEKENTTVVENKNVQKDTLSPTRQTQAEPSKDSLSDSAQEVKKSVAAQTSGTIDLGYATYTGKLKNGKPDGIGTMTFKQAHLIDSRDPQQRMAEAGDSIRDGDFNNGHLVQGNLYSSSGEKKGFIMIGG